MKNKTKKVKKRNRIFSAILLFVCLFVVFSSTCLASSGGYAGSATSQLYNMGISPSLIQFGAGVVLTSDGADSSGNVSSADVICSLDYDYSGSWYYNPNLISNSENSIDTFVLNERQNIGVVGYRFENWARPDYYEKPFARTDITIDTLFDKNANYIEFLTNKYGADYRFHFFRSVTHFGYTANDYLDLDGNFESYTKSVTIVSDPFGYDVGSGGVPYITFPYFDITRYNRNEYYLAGYIRLHGYYVDKDSNEKIELSIDKVYRMSDTLYKRNRFDLIPNAIRSNINSDFVYFDSYYAQIGYIPIGSYSTDGDTFITNLNTSGAAFDGASDYKLLDTFQNVGSGFYLYNPVTTVQNIHSSDLSNLMFNGADIVYRDITDITAWIGDTVGNFFDIEILPGVKLASILGIIIAVVVTTWILKLMAGG